jgi:hypothetical protein
MDESIWELEFGDMDTGQSVPRVGLICLWNRCVTFQLNGGPLSETKIGNPRRTDYLLTERVTG